MKYKRACAISNYSSGISTTVLFALIFAGCVVNFKNAHPKTKGIIHVDAHYLYPGRNEFSSSDKFYKKEIASGRFAETKTIELDPGQQLLVLNKALVLHFFEMPDSFFHANHYPASPQFLRISADTLDKTIRWSGSLDSLHPAGHHLEELVEYVDSIVKSTDAFQALPSN